MKHILLATTTLAMSAGVAAADISTSASAKLSYGNFGDDHLRAGDVTPNTDCCTLSTNAAPDAGWGMEANFNVIMSGEDGGISYSAGLEVDETATQLLKKSHLAHLALQFLTTKNEYSGLTTTAADGGTDNLGDAKISYAGNGLTFSYEINEDATMPMLLT